MAKTTKIPIVGRSGSNTVPRDGSENIALNSSGSDSENVKETKITPLREGEGVTKHGEIVSGGSNGSPVDPAKDVNDIVNTKYHHLDRTQTRSRLHQHLSGDFVPTGMRESSEGIPLDESRTLDLSAGSSATSSDESPEKSVQAGSKSFPRGSFTSTKRTVEKEIKRGVPHTRENLENLKVRAELEQAEFYYKLYQILHGDGGNIADINPHALEYFRKDRGFTDRQIRDLDKKAKKGFDAYPGLKKAYDDAQSLSNSNSARSKQGLDSLSSTEDLNTKEPLIKEAALESKKRLKEASIVAEGEGGGEKSSDIPHGDYAVDPKSRLAADVRKRIADIFSHNSSRGNEFIDALAADLSSVASGARNSSPDGAPNDIDAKTRRARVADALDTDFYLPLATLLLANTETAASALKDLGFSDAQISYIFKRGQVVQSDLASSHGMWDTHNPEAKIIENDKSRGFSPRGKRMPSPNDVADVIAPLVASLYGDNNAGYNVGSDAAETVLPIFNASRKSAIYDNIINGGGYTYAPLTNTLDPKALYRLVAYNAVVDLYPYLNPANGVEQSSLVTNNGQTIQRGPKLPLINSSTLKPEFRWLAELPPQTMRDAMASIYAKYAVDHFNEDVPPVLDFFTEGVPTLYKTDEWGLKTADSYTRGTSTRGPEQNAMDYTKSPRLVYFDPVAGEFRGYDPNLHQNLGFMPAELAGPISNFEQAYKKFLFENTNFESGGISLEDIVSADREGTSNASKISNLVSQAVVDSLPLDSNGEPDFSTYRAKLFYLLTWIKLNHPDLAPFSTAQQRQQPSDLHGEPGLKFASNSEDTDSPKLTGAHSALERMLGLASTDNLGQTEYISSKGDIWRKAAEVDAPLESAKAEDVKGAQSATLAAAGNLTIGRAFMDARDTRSKYRTLDATSLNDIDTFYRVLSTSLATRFAESADKLASDRKNFNANVNDVIYGALQDTCDQCVLDPKAPPGDAKRLFPETSQFFRYLLSTTLGFRKTFLNKNVLPSAEYFDSAFNDLRDRGQNGIGKERFTLSLIDALETHYKNFRFDKVKGEGRPFNKSLSPSAFNLNPKIASTSKGTFVGTFSPEVHDALLDVSPKYRELVETSGGLEPYQFYGENEKAVKDAMDSFLDESLGSYNRFVDFIRLVPGGEAFAARSTGENVTPVGSVLDTGTDNAATALRLGNSDKFIVGDEPEPWARARGARDAFVIPLFDRFNFLYTPEGAAAGAAKLFPPDLAERALYDEDPNLIEDYAALTGESLDKAISLNEGAGALGSFSRSSHGDVSAKPASGGGASLDPTFSPVNAGTFIKLANAIRSAYRQYVGVGDIPPVSDVDALKANLVSAYRGNAFLGRLLSQIVSQHRASYDSLSKAYADLIYADSALAADPHNESLLVTRDTLLKNYNNLLEKVPSILFPGIFGYAASPNEPIEKGAAYQRRFNGPNDVSDIDQRTLARDFGFLSNILAPSSPEAWADDLYTLTKDRLSEFGVNIGTLSMKELSYCLARTWLDCVGLYSELTSLSHVGNFRPYRPEVNTSIADQLNRQAEHSMIGREKPEDDGATDL